MSTKEFAHFAFSLSAGAVVGFMLLLSKPDVTLMTTVCGKPRMLTVVYAMPYSDPTNYSDPDVNVVDCFQGDNNE
jgi:hypothetical protein